MQEAENLWRQRLIVSPASGTETLKTPHAAENSFYKLVALRLLQVLHRSAIEMQPQKYLQQQELWQ